jgi:hypothetical protein
MRDPTQYRVGAAVLLVLGVLCVLVELQSPSIIQWTGQRVLGTDEGGIAYYAVGGQERTLDVRGKPPAHPVPVTVYADPDDASRDQVSGPAKWLDATLVLAPFLAAGIVLAAGVGRRGRLRRLAAARESRRRAEATSGGVRPDDAVAPRPSGSSRWRRSSR